MLDENTLKNFDVSKLNGFNDFRIEKSDLKLQKEKSKVTLGFIDTFERIKKITIVDYQENKIDDIELAKNCINIYQEKNMYLFNRDIIVPDLDMICRILDNHFTAMKKLRVLIKPLSIKNKTDLFKYFDLNSFNLKINYPWATDNKGYTSLDSRIQLYITKTNQFKMGLSIRIPTQAGHVMKMYVLPNDNDFIYLLRSPLIKKRGSCILFEKEEEIQSYLLKVLFENTYYYKSMKQLLGSFEYEDVNDETFEVMEMFKFN